MGYTKDDVHQILLNQREYFLSGKTLDVKYRIEQLKKLREAVIKNEVKIEEALYQDLGRSKAEAYFFTFAIIFLSTTKFFC